MDNQGYRGATAAEMMLWANVRKVCHDLGIQPERLMATIKAESRQSPAVPLSRRARLLQSAAVVKGPVKDQTSLRSILLGEVKP